MARLLKTAYEQWTIAIEYDGRLPSGESLLSGTVECVDHLGADTSATILVTTTATVSGTQMKTIVRAGAVGDRHAITFKTLLSGGTKLEDTVFLEIVGTG